MTQTGGSRAMLDDDMRSDEDDDSWRHENTRGSDPGILWAVLRWRIGRIVAIAVATVLLAAIALAILPAKYKATAILLVDPRQTNVTKTETVLPGIGPDTAFVESQVEIIESTTLARKVIDQLNLENDPEFAKPGMFETVSDAVRRLFGATPAVDPAVRIAKIESRFRERVSARRRGLTYNIEVNAVSADPAKAALIANTLAKDYIEDQQRARTEVTTRASNWLDARIDELKTRARESDRAVGAYKAAHNLVDVTQGNTLINRQVEDLTQQLALARSRAAEAKGRLERAEQASGRGGEPNTLTEALQSPVIAVLRGQYAETARLLAQQQTIYGDKSPELSSTRAQLADLRRQLDAELARIIKGVRSDYLVAKDREATLVTELNKLKEVSGSQSNENAELRQLEREAQSDKALFEEFLKRAKETSEQKTLQIPDARVISPALIPLKPDRPSALALLPAAGFAGGLFGIGLVLLQERMRRGFRTAYEIEQALSLPVLGVLPNQAAAGWRSRKPSAAPIAVANRTRIAVDDPASPYSGNLRAIRMRLRLSAPDPGHEVLAVVSALSGEGKTTFACNLALTSAMAGTRTLLIDADIYVSGRAQSFALYEAKLEDKPGATLPYRGAVRKDAKTGLFTLELRELLRAQTLSDDKLETAFTEMVKDCREQFDLTIIDCPAALQCTESVDLVGSADRAVLLVKWDGTERRAAADVLRLLGPLSRKVAGVVLNMVPLKWWRMFESGRYVDYGSYYGLPPEPARSLPPGARGGQMGDSLPSGSRSFLTRGRSAFLTRAQRPGAIERARSAQ